MTDDEHYLSQVIKLNHTANLAREEAEHYASLIEDEEIKKQAEKELSL